MGMGRELLGSVPVFAEALAGVGEALAPHLDWSLLEAVREGVPSLERVDVVQPVSFAVMVALARTWEWLGVVPEAVVGHSQGEIAAAHVAGALTLEDAAAVVALRSQAIARGLAGRGGMVSVAVSAERIAGRLGGGVELAAVNGPSSVVVAGDPAALDELVAGYEAEGVRVRRVPVDYASHTSHVEAIESDLARVLAGIKPQAARVPFFSSVEARWLDGPELDGGYWYRNLRQTVRFAEATAALAADGFRAFVEVSSHPVLAPSVAEVLDEHTQAPTVVTGTLRRDDGGLDRLLLSAAELYVRGLPVDWTPLLGTPPSRLPALPTYAFQHERYWLDPVRPTADVRATGLAPAGHPLLGAVVEMPDGAVSLTGRVSLADHPWLADHTVSGTVLLPGAALLDLALRAGDETELGGGLEELVVEAPLALPAEGGVDLRVTVGVPDEATGRRAVTVHSRPEDGATWTRHVEGLLAPASGTPGPSAPGEWPPAGSEAVDLDGFHARLAADGFAYGPAFRGLRAVWRHGADAYAEVTLPEGAGDGGTGGGFWLHPALLDAALQATHVLGATDPGPGRLLLPFAWNDVTVQATGATAVRVHARRTGPEAFGLTLSDQAGAEIARIGSLVLRPVPVERLTALGSTAADHLYRLDWTTPLTLPATADPVPEQAVLDLTGRPALDPAAARGLAVEAVDFLHARFTDPATAGLTLAVVTDHPGTAPAAGSVWGLTRSLQLEQPGRVVLVAADSAADARCLLPSILATGVPQAAVTAGRVTVPRLARAAVQPTAPSRNRLDPDGTVLITGGTGTLGGLVARHLVAVHGVRR
ncbi:MAG: acyltransferase domain-containing protein, partial [Streptomyces sp.]|nr:acyltransferase domain-containing protein [Streptomyces sp.]